MSCYYSNICKDKYKCCNYCDNKSCQYRCKDDHKNCIYYVNEKKQTLELFKSIVNNNKFSLNYLYKELSINRLTIARIIKENDVNVWEETLNKIKEFNEKYK